LKQNICKTFCSSENTWYLNKYSNVVVQTFCKIIFWTVSLCKYLRNYASSLRDKQFSFISVVPVAIKKLLNYMTLYQYRLGKYEVARNANQILNCQFLLLTLPGGWLLVGTTSFVNINMKTNSHNSWSNYFCLLFL